MKTPQSLYFQTALCNSAPNIIMADIIWKSKIDMGELTDQKLVSTINSLSKGYTFGTKFGVRCTEVSAFHSCLPYRGVCLRKSFIIVNNL